MKLARLEERKKMTDLSASCVDDKSDGNWDFLDRLDLKYGRGQSKCLGGFWGRNRLEAKLSVL